MFNTEMVTDIIVVKFFLTVGTDPAGTSEALTSNNVIPPSLNMRRVWWDGEQKEVYFKAARGHSSGNQAFRVRQA
jgi:hypothetical protein